jgi:hypothetical protein
MSKFTTTALVALALAGSIGGALAQQAPAAPAQNQQVTPQAPAAQPAPVRSRVASRQILLEPTAPAAPVAAAPAAPAVAPAAPAVAAAPAEAQPQVQAQVQPVDAPAPQVTPAPQPEAVPAQPKAVPPGIVVKRERFEHPGYGYRHQYSYAPRYAGYGHNCHRGGGYYRGY